MINDIIRSQTCMTIDSNYQKRDPVTTRILSKFPLVRVIIISVFVRPTAGHRRPLGMRVFGSRFSRVLSSVAVMADIYFFHFIRFFFASDIGAVFFSLRLSQKLSRHANGNSRQSLLK